jgi:hypothetical protein
MGGEMSVNESNSILVCPASEKYLLGTVDAYCEVSNIKNLFVPTDHYKIYSGNKDRIFLCGRTGSGKSAIAIKLLSEPEYKYTFLFSSPRFYLTIADILRDYTVNVQDIFSAIWEYVFSLGVVCAVWRNELMEGNYDSGISDYMWRINVKAYPKKKDIDEDLSGIVSLENEIYDHITRCFERIFRNIDMKNHGKILSLSIKNAFRELKREEAFREALKYCVERVANNCVVIVDTVKRFGINDQVYINVIRAMLQTAKDMQLLWKKRGPTLKCFIHAEIYDDTVIDEPKKYEKQSVFLRWRYKDLILVLAKRFIAAEGELLSKQKMKFENLDRTNVKELFWDRIMVPVITNRLEMIEHSLAYMVRHTQKRPRQVIALFSEIIEAARLNKKSAVSGEHDAFIFDESSLIHGIHGKNNMMSMLKDILAVYSGPNGLAPKEVEVMLDGESFFQKQKDIKRIAKRLYPYLSMSIYSPEEIIGLLLRSGLLGKVVGPVHEWEEDAGKGMYLITIFEYQQQGYLNFNEISEFGVHPILSDSIGLRKPNHNFAVIYPYPEPDELVGFDVYKYVGRID